jgi:DHA1 family multidrug resistance protein-like MFS transporter
MFGIGLATPILPLYASSLGASWTEIGLMGTSWGIMTTLLATVAGRVSDRLGRRPLLIASAALSSAAAFLYLISSTILQVILLRILEGAAWAFFWPTVEALATEIANPRLAGRAMGFVTVSYAIAFGASSLSGGSIAGALGYKFTFVVYLAFAVLSIPFAISLHDHAQRTALGTRQENEEHNLSELMSKQVFLAYVLGITYTIGLGALLTFFSVFAKTLGATVFLVGGLFAFFWTGRILGSYGGGRLSDKHGRGLVAIGAMLGSTVGFIVIAVSNGIWALLVGVIVTGLSIGATFPVGVALISDHINESLRGFAMGIFETACGAGVMLGAAIGGILADMYSPNAPYLMAAAVNLACATLFTIQRVK